MPDLELRDLGVISYAQALDIQKSLAEQRKRGEIADQLLIVEHPNVITLGRNGHLENLLASNEILERTGITFHHSDRGGDITYHGPGQIVGYPIMDLREWKRDVVAYVRAMEQAIIDTIAGFGISGHSVPGCTGVWAGGSGPAACDARKIAAIGIHISRWITTHGFALNHTTDLKYFQYIVPCGIAKPVTSMREEGSTAARQDVVDSLARHFAQTFDRTLTTQLVETIS